MLVAVNNVNPIAAINPMSGLKPSYGFASTAELIAVLNSKGWVVSQTKVASVKKPEKLGFQRHMIMFEHPVYSSIEGLTKDNASKPMLCLFNSHDASTSLRLTFGLLRGACLNLNIFGSALRDFRAVHSNNITARLADGVEYMTANIEDLLGTVRKLQNSTISPAGVDAIVKRVTQERLKNVKNIIDVDYEMVTKPIRPEDTAGDAFTVLNIIQEKLIRKGGIPYLYDKITYDANGKELFRTPTATYTKALKSIPSQLRVNEVLFKTALDVIQ